MAHTCPWFIGYLLITPLRALVQNPSKILAPHLDKGYAVFEPGPGMGFFTLEMARRVGANGRVYVSDVQPQMLSNLRRRAAKTGVASQVETRTAKEDSLCVDDLEGKIDFVLSFAVTHEMPDIDRFFAQSSAVLKKGGRMLHAEPKGHVSPQDFEQELAAAKKHGLRIVSQPPIWSSHTALLVKD